LQPKIKSIPKFWWKNYEKLRSKAPKLISFRKNRYSFNFEEIVNSKYTELANYISIDTPSELDEDNYLFFRPKKSKIEILPKSKISMQ